MRLITKNKTIWLISKKNQKNKKSMLNENIIVIFSLLGFLNDLNDDFSP